MSFLWLPPSSATTDFHERFKACVVDTVLPVSFRKTHHQCGFSAPGTYSHLLNYLLKKPRWFQLERLSLRFLSVHVKMQVGCNAVCKWKSRHLSGRYKGPHRPCLLCFALWHNWEQHREHGCKNLVCSSYQGPGSVLTGKDLRSVPRAGYSIEWTTRDWKN